MARKRRKDRFGTKPSTMEVNIRAIPLLKPNGWRLYTLEEVPLIGAVPKNYLAYGNPHSPGTLGYIAKKGRMKNDARECVTEEIISKIGTMLPVKMARSKLVRIANDDVRFLSQNFVVHGQYELLHGIELVAHYFQTNPSEVEAAFELQKRKQEQQFYTVKNILTIMESLYPHDFLALKESFYKMLAFDAFVGAPDRHGTNWGVLAPLTQSGPIRFAPIFDTARGLFREYSDADLIKKASEQGRDEFLERYANGSHPIVGTGQEQPDNHFSLMKWIAVHDSEMCSSTIGQVFNRVHLPSIEQMIQRRFRRIITQDRIGFIIDLLALRIKRIRQEVQV